MADGSGDDAAGGGGGRTKWRAAARTRRYLPVYDNTSPDPPSYPFHSSISRPSSHQKLRLAKPESEFIDKRRCIQDIQAKEVELAKPELCERS